MNHDVDTRVYRKGALTWNGLIIGKILPQIQKRHYNSFQKNTYFLDFEQVCVYQIVFFMRQSIPEF